ncbi:MAG: thioesterase family protein [Clostridiaceae bacterium]
MKELIQVGIIREDKRKVNQEDTAVAMKSGDLSVYATPALVAFLEYTAKELVRKFLDDNETTVGIRMDLNHIKASKVGSAIHSKAEVIEVNGKKITFKVEAYEGETLIGFGTHERFVVDKIKFISKLG